MNVLFLTTNYPRPESPIDGIFVREHARAAAEIADVRVVHLLRAPAARGLVRLERIEGEEPAAWRVPYRRFGRPLAQLAFVLGPLALVRRFRRDGWVPDVIHASSLSNRKPRVGAEWRSWRRIAIRPPASSSSPAGRSRTSICCFSSGRG